MPWIFGLLLVMNIAYFGWAFLSGQPVAPRDVVIEDSGGKTLHLLAEKQSGEGKRQARNEDGASACYLIGPFREGEVQSAQARMRNMGLNAELRSLEANGEEYWLYIPPFRYSEDAASAVAALKRKGIKGTVVEDGPYARAVSIEHFALRPKAEEQLKSMVAQGFQVELRSIKRQEREQWLYVSSPKPGRNVRALLDGSLPFGQELRRELSSCEE